MPITSYLIFPKQGEEDKLERSLMLLSNCEVYPDKNKRVFALVTEIESRKEEEEFFVRLQTHEHLNHITLVSGFITEHHEQESLQN